MGKQKNISRNKKQSSGSGRPIIALALVIIFILSVFLLLEMVKRQQIVRPEEEPSKASRWTMPAHQEPVQPRISSAVHKTPQTSIEHPAIKRKKPIIGHGSVAIIVDDMGGNLREAQALLAIPIPITFSVIPGLAKSREVAETAHKNGHEVMLHIPMEPKGYENKPFEKNGLLIKMSDQELERRLASYLVQVPNAAGANNHMGSRFTEDEAKMRIILNQLKARGLYFIDSKTSPQSIGDRLARQMGVDTAARTIFLDNIQDVTAIRKQLEQLSTAAKKNGVAIGICHPHRITIQALASTLPDLQRSGIKFVYASELTR